MMTMDQAQLASYLTKRMSVPVVVNRIKQSFPGISRETWLIDAEISGERRGLVVRIDPPEGGSGPASLEAEWEIYRRLYGSQVPVAEPLWYDGNSEVSGGRPLMVRRLVDGSPTITGLHDRTADASAMRLRVVRECIEKLALVHTLDWKALGFGELLRPPSSASAAFRTEFDLWRGYWDSRKTGPDPVFEEVLVWLSEHIPDDTPRISLVKGNNGIGEEIWREGRIVAMSDWELGCLGDGISDLFWSQGTVRLCGFAEALRHYELCMGQSVSPNRLAFASLFALAKQIICAVVFWYRHHFDGRTKRIYALAGMTYVTESRIRLGKCIGKSLAEAWEILSAGEKNMYTHLSGSEK
jgi:aminoglycoside phosphotransferase (APT) family kinase protein